MKIDKKKIKQIALDCFHSVYHESVYDLWTDALEVYLKREGLKIVPMGYKAPDESREEDTPPSKTY